MNASIEMPRYRCHKEVRALQIGHIALPLSASEKAEIIPTDTSYGPIPVTDEWMAKHQPRAGGYFVLYDDGYTSFSPAKAFEEGYTRIDDAQA